MCVIIVRNKQVNWKVGNIVRQRFRKKIKNWTKHGGIILYDLVNHLCNFVNKIIKETLN